MSGITGTFDTRSKRPGASPVGAQRVSGGAR